MDHAGYAQKAAIIHSYVSGQHTRIYENTIVTDLGIVRKIAKRTDHIIVSDFDVIAEVNVVHDPVPLPHILRPDHRFWGNNVGKMKTPVF